MSLSGGRGPARYKVQSALPDSCGAPMLPTELLYPEEPVVDLACCDMVQVRQSTERLRWAGDTFYFCSSFCRHRFATAPTTFVPMQDRNGEISGAWDDHVTAVPHR